jgi:hypothetical protein
MAVPRRVVHTTNGTKPLTHLDAMEFIRPTGPGGVGSMLVSPVADECPSVAQGRQAGGELD